MKKIIEKREWMNHQCPTCGHLLLNPGYNRDSAWCCGTYHQWGHYEDVSYEIETGRDERGRFTGKKVQWKRIHA